MKMFPLGEMGKYAIVSSKGATVVTHVVDNAVIIFPQTVIDSKPRGGIPICLPYFGEPRPKFREIGKHGWLRDQELNISWEKKNPFTLSGFRQMKMVYPWSLMYEVQFAVKPEGSLVIGLRIARLHDGIDGLAPVNPAFHPYFCSNLGTREAVVFVDDKGWVVEDGITKIVPAGEKILINTGAKKVEMCLAGDFNRDSQPARLALWTDNPQKYFCVEPMLTHPDVFDTPAGQFLEQGQVLSLYCTLSVL